MPVGIPAGMLSAIGRYGGFDYAVTELATLGDQRSKGLTESLVVSGHVLRSSLIPGVTVVTVVTVVTLVARHPHGVGGGVVTEQINRVHGSASCW